PRPIRYVIPICPIYATCCWPQSADLLRFGLFIAVTPLPPRSPLFPYTTLFRSPRRARTRTFHPQHAGRGGARSAGAVRGGGRRGDRKSTRLNSSHVEISYAVFCLKKKNSPVRNYSNRWRN